MNKSKKTILLIAEAAIISVLVILVLVKPNVNKRNIQSGVTVTENGITEDKPTFMYFVTDAELADKEISGTVKKLKDEYEETVSFDIKNVDADKKLLEEFPVKDNTPTLIMLKANGDIVNILFKTAEYDKLKAAIDGAFEN